MDTLIPGKNAIQTSKFHTWMGEDGICRTVTIAKAEIDIDDAAENTNAVSALYKGKKFPLMVDSRPIKSMTRDARKHFSTNGRETKISCMAVLVKSPLSKVIGNFFIGLNKPQVPARLFDSEAEAVEWLKKFLE
jgi:hypothetical protein